MKDAQRKFLADTFESLPRDRRQDGARVVQAMKEDRKHLQQSLKKFVALYPFKDEVRSTKALSELCRCLNAYIAMAHFGAFRRVADGEERRAEARRVAVVVYPTIEQSTEKVLGFDAKYRNCNPWTTGRRLTRELSALGKCLNERFHLEDQLLDAMHKSERPSPKAESDGVGLDFDVTSGQVPKH